MFDLESAIRLWRSQMTSRGLQADEVLTELESHLRDDVEARIELGSAPEQAFEQAVSSLGGAETVRNEFNKLTSRQKNQPTEHSVFGLNWAKDYILPMNTTNPASIMPREACWPTYIKAAAFLMPSVCLFAFSAVFLFPKVQQICHDAAFVAPALFRIMLALMGLLRENGVMILGASIVVFVLLEFRSGKWPRYRGTSLGIIVFLVNSAVLVLMTSMFIMALMAAPALFHNK